MGHWGKAGQALAGSIRGYGLPDMQYHHAVAIIARGVIARHGAPLRSICLISTNASAATCCILLHAKAYASNRIQMLNTATYAPSGARRCVR